ncbi:MAG: cache domain-containing protein [Synergistaceae bacterium]|jgi:PAS domain S-box-containing protein|nr:cache domain-containing protein [Synergistaceae bacterium]
MAKLRVRSIVFLVSFFLVLAGVTVTSTISSFVFVDAMRAEVDDAVLTAVDGLGREINSTIDRMKVFGRVFADMGEIVRLIEMESTYELNKLMLSYLNVSGFDSIMVTDAAGMVLSRPHAKNFVGDDASEKTYVEAALNGESVIAVEPAKIIGMNGLWLFYGTPVKRGPRVVGSIIAGVNLGNNDILDRLSGMYRAEMTVFYGDTRMSTTFKDDNGRILDTKADPSVAETVIGKGESLYGELRLADGHMFRTLYKPFVLDGNRIGMLSAGVPTSFLDDAVDNAMHRVLVGAAVFVLLALCASYVFARTISKLATEKTQQEFFLNLLMQNSPDTILMFDNEGRFIHCTDDFLRKTGVENFSEISGRLFSDVLGNFLDDSEVFRLSGIFSSSMAEGKNTSFDIAIDFSGEGSLSSYMVRFTPMFSDDGMIGGMAIFHDLTDLIKAQRAEAASQAKSAFLANISHEIRTPLNAVIGLSEIELRSDLPDETRANVEKIYTSGATLLGIINDVLDISKIESGRFEIVPVQYDFPNLISDAMHLNVVRIASKPIKFEPRIDEDIPMRLFGDEIRIKQILNNLLSNAFKYTLEGVVALSVTCERSDNGVLMKFVVSDTGVGIKKEDIGQLFSEYVQLDIHANRKIEGTGLGLSICKSLVDMMNGTIGVESEYGAGSIFTVRIWQGISDPTPIGVEIARNLKTFRLMDNRRAKNLIRAPMPYARILVVDDVITNLDVAKGLMLPYGMTIHCASSGARAIDIVREAKVRYDVIFMDHMMPEMDGVEAVRIIRGEIGTEYARTVPIIALTANALVGNEEMFLSNGFQAYLSKPIDIIKLDALLNRFVRSEDAERAYIASLASVPSASDVLDPGAAPGSAGKRRLPESMWFIDGLDIESGISRFGDEDVYLKVIRSYVGHTPTLLRDVRGLERGNLPEYAVTVHGIKGSSFGICAVKVGEMAEELEFYAKRGEYEITRSKNVEFVMALEKLISDLGSILKEMDIASACHARIKMPMPNAALFDSLLERCGHYDSTGMEAILTELESYDYESGGEFVEWLRKKLDELEYDEIKERLQTGTGERYGDRT